MAKKASAVPLPPLKLDPASSVPVYRQLYDGLRGAVLEGRLKPGVRLPSTRALAEGLGLSRSTVVNAFSQLLAEGYLEGRVGSGTYVSHSLPEELMRICAGRKDHSDQRRREGKLSRRGEVLASTHATASRNRGAARAFRPGVPALDEFPFEEWSRFTSRRWRKPPRELLGYGDPAGYRPLRRR